MALKHSLALEKKTRQIMDIWVVKMKGIIAFVADILYVVSLIHILFID